MRDVVLLLGSLLCTTRRIGIVHQESIYGSAHLIRSQYEHVQERGMQRRGSRTSAKDNKIACLNYRRSVPYYGIRADMKLAAEKPLSCLRQCICWKCVELLGVGVQGFVIGAHSVAGSKFKLLMFEATEEGQWELLLQEDSIRVSPSVIFLHLTASTRH